MLKKIFLLLFLCSIFCQPIFATLSDEDTSLSSDSLVRKRRVIDHAPGGQHETVNYIVKIMERNHIICSGAILSHNTAITAANCVYEPIMHYKVLSGGAYNSEWNYHNITSEVEYSGNPPIHGIDTILLLHVHPPFVYSRTTGNIALHAGPLHEGSLINVFGWERVYLQRPGIVYMYRLRSITIPIMNYRQCVNLYHNRLIVSEKHICTICTQQFCLREEIGGPLVVNNRLAGIQTYKGPIPGQINPDVFVNLQVPSYSQWIRTHTR